VLLFSNHFHVEILLSELQIWIVLHGAFKLKSKSDNIVNFQEEKSTKKALTVSSDV